MPRKVAKDRFNARHIALIFKKHTGCSRDESLVYASLFIESLIKFFGEHGEIRFKNLCHIFVEKRAYAKPIPTGLHGKKYKSSMYRIKCEWSRGLRKYLNSK